MHNIHTDEKNLRFSGSFWANEDFTIIFDDTNSSWAYDKFLQKWSQ